MKNYREDNIKKEEEKKKEEKEKKKEDKEEKEKDETRQKVKKIIDKIETGNEQIITKYENALKGIIDYQKDYTVNNKEDNNMIVNKKDSNNNNIEINFEKFSMLAKTKNYIIKFFNRNIIKQFFLHLKYIDFFS